MSGRTEMPGLERDGNPWKLVRQGVRTDASVGCPVGSSMVVESLASSMAAVRILLVDVQKSGSLALLLDV